MDTITIDASPIIFLAKINQLSVINTLFPTGISVLQCIIDEIYSYSVPIEEDLAIKDFLAQCTVHNHRKKNITASSLSDNDTILLSFAILKHIDLLITDDNVVRKVAAHENIPSIGTLGILIKTVEYDVLPPGRVLQDINDLIENHQFRISIEVYQRVRVILENIAK